LRICTEREESGERESMVIMDMMTLLWSLMGFLGARQSGTRAKQIGSGKVKWDKDKAE
jgi:hypothetical protein